MPKTSDLSGAYVKSAVTDAVKKLAELENGWVVASEDRDTAWARLRGSAYDPRAVDRFKVKSDLCSMLAHRIIQHKKNHRI